MSAALRVLAPVVCVVFAGCAPPPEPAWSGYAEGEYVQVAAPLAGALQTLAVRSGQQVAAGAALFTLDATPDTAAAAEAQARVRSAQAQAADTDKGRRADEIAVTEAQLAQARAQAKLAAAELARVQPLVAQNFLAPQKLDDARTAVAQAEARVAELQAALRVAKLPARGDQRSAAQALAEAASQAWRQSAWREAQKRQAAPVAGEVADTYFRVGEWVNAGQPVVSLLPPGGRKVRFFVPQAALPTLAAGSTVTLHCDGCGAPIAARVSFIATQAEYTPPVIYSNAQRAKLVFMVEARPDDAAGAARLRPGQPVDVRLAAARAS